MKKLAIASFLVVTAVAVYLLATPHSPEPASTGAAGTASQPAGRPELEPAPALALPGLDGKTVKLSDFKGKVVLVDFWATWCDPCKEEIPELVKLYPKLKDKGFVLLGVDMDEEGAPAVKKFLAKQPIDYPLVLNGGERAPKGWTVPGLPTAYLIGKDGTVRKRWFGEKDPEELEQAVTAALAK